MVNAKVIEVLNNGKQVFFPESDSEFVNEIKMELDVIVEEVTDEETGRIILAVRKNPNAVAYRMVKWYRGRGHKVSHRTVAKNLTLAKANAMLNALIAEGKNEGADFEMSIHTM